MALGTFKVSAIAPGTAGGALTVEVQDAEGEAAGDRFKLIVKDGETVVENFDVSAKKSARNFVVTQVKQRSKMISVEETVAGGQLAKPDAQAVTLAPPAAAPAPAPAGGTVARIETGQFIGDSADRTGFGGLEAFDEINMVAVPDLMAAYQQGLIDLEQVKAVQLGLIAHCELMGDRMAVLDPPPGLNARDNPQVADGGRRLRLASTPPCTTPGSRSSTRPRARPSSSRRRGHMAGIWARNDSERGVHKAPANEVVRGAVDLETPDHPRRAGPPQPDRRQLHPRLPGPRHPRLGRPHPRLRPGLALPQRPPATSTTWRSRS